MIGRTAADQHSLGQRLLPAAALGLAGLVLLLGGTPNAFGRLTVTVNNSQTVTSSGIFSCDGASDATGSAYLDWLLKETSGTTAADSSGNGRTGTYTGTITYGAAGPCSRDGAKAVTLNGTNAYVTQTSTTAVTPGTSFSVEIWFKTPNTTTTGGKLIGFGSSRTGASTTVDRHLYMTNAGTIGFGVLSGGTTRTSVVSTTALNNNAWHQAVGTFAPATDDNPGMRLYIDGALVKTDTTVTAAGTTAGFWRVGYDTVTGGWASAPSSAYFKGSVAAAQVYTDALTPNEVTGMYNMGIA